ncbi:MAG: DegT/DnrJ/EryC1/StrS family aminotransferase [Planctomycetes bacterium]|nr:DegT/DnrJ/EryC1/StrS family aminotransferase [Planctomycetota bacterium]
MVTSTSKLAINGGKPISETPLKPESWPPVSEETAERMKELYLSREWSFHSPAEQEFARAYADYHGAKHGIFMVNGTVTIQCALAALGVGEGDEVIVPALTWMATAMAAYYLGATPVFVDLEPSTLCLDPDQLEDAITPKTGAVVPVHLYSSMADLEKILQICESKGVPVVEDCAHMQGGKWDGRGVGSWGHVGSFSFQQSKTLSCGEGGICLTDDDELADRIFRLKHIGYAPGNEQGRPSGSPPEDLVCHNFRATAFQALILREQLRNLSERIELYDKNASKIREHLENVPGVRVQSRGRLASPQGYYAIVFIFDEEPCRDVPRASLVEALEAEGLNVGGTYGPVYDHVLFNPPEDRYRIHGGRCEVAEYVATERAVSLSHPWLGADEETIDAVGEIFTKVATQADDIKSLDTEGK